VLVASEMRGRKLAEQGEIKRLLTKVHFGRISRAARDYTANKEQKTRAIKLPERNYLNAAACVFVSERHSR
jgi:hypothetical protein